MTDPRSVTALTGVSAGALREFAEIVLEVRDGFRDNVKLFTERAGELAADPIRAALCRGQAIAYQEAAEHIGEAVAIASGQWRTRPG